MASETRIRRIGDLIQQEIAGLLQKEVKDPRVQGVSITAVDVTRDLSLARIYYVVIDKNKKSDASQGLKKASGFIRHELGKSLQLRITPKLEFRYDDSVSRGAELSRLIDDVIADDRNRYHSDEN